MSKEELLESIGQVKDEFIEEAAPKGLLNTAETKVETDNKQGRITKMYPYLKMGALAACLCIIVGLGVKIAPFSATKNDMAFDMVEQMRPTTESESFNTKAEAPMFDYENKKNKDYTTGNYEIGADTAINDNTVASSETTDEDNGFPDWGLSLSVKNVTSTGLTLVVTQSGGNPTGDILTGESYRLITLVDDTWKVVEELPLPEGVDGRGFNSIGYWIQKDETREFNIDWNWIYGELPGGTYRLIKEFSDFRETANYDPFEYWVEFDIE